MTDLALPEVRHPARALRLVTDDAGRALAFRPGELPVPYRETVDHAARQPFEPARLPALLAGRQSVYGLAVEPIEVITDQRGFFQADAIVAHEVRHPPGRVDAVVRALRRARL